VRCSQCAVEFLHPQPTPEVLNAIYSANYFLGDSEGIAQSEVFRQKHRTAEMYVRQILTVTGGRKGALLEVGCGSGEFLGAALEQGFQVKGIEISEHAAATANSRLGATAVQCGDIESVSLRPAEFDIAVFSDVIEHVRDPHAFMRRVHYCLRPGGIVFVVTPTTDSWSHRVMQNRWMEYKLEHLFYFNRRSISFLFGKHNFSQVKILPNAKALSFDYIRAHFRRFPIPFWSKAVDLIGAVVPYALSRKVFPVVASGMIATARKNSLS
jgi:SAM-dependent methyltransferase